MKKKRQVISTISVSNPNVFFIFREDGTEVTIDKSSYTSSNKLYIEEVNHIFNMYRFSPKFYKIIS